jgi:hypothetical protein
MRNALASIAILLITPGCAAIQDWHYNEVNCLRTECAWIKCAGSVRCVICASDYGHGWKEGYFCVSTGGSGQPPTLPPKKYWCAKYQNSDGQQAIADWYAGFQDGVIMAERRGAGQYHYLHPHGLPTGCPEQYVDGLSQAQAEYGAAENYREETVSDDQVNPLRPSAPPSPPAPPAYSTPVDPSELPPMPPVPPVPPAEALPRSGSREPDAKPAIKNSLRRNVPRLDSTGLNATEPQPGSDPVIVRLPPSTDSAQHAASPAANMLGQLSSPEIFPAPVGH